MRTPARHALPAHFASADLLSHASESAAESSLHRRAASANGGACCAKMAQTSPMVIGTEVAAEDAAAGGVGGAQSGPIDESCRRARPLPPPGGVRPPLGHRGRREAPGRCRAGLPAPTGGAVGGRAAGWVKGGAGDVATDRALCPRNLLLYTRAHVVVSAVVLCMMLPNHACDQAESLVYRNDHWSNRQSSQWT